MAHSVRVQQFRCSAAAADAGHGIIPASHATLSLNIRMFCILKHNVNVLIIWESVRFTCPVYTSTTPHALTLSAHPKGHPAPFQEAYRGQRHHDREEEPAGKRKGPLPIQGEHHCTAKKRDARRRDDPYAPGADDVYACCQEEQGPFRQFDLLPRKLGSPGCRGIPPT